MMYVHQKYLKFNHESVDTSVSGCYYKTIKEVLGEPGLHFVHGERPASNLLIAKKNRMAEDRVWNKRDD